MAINQIGTRPKITLQSLTEECQRILNLRGDTAKIEERDISNIHTLKIALVGRMFANGPGNRGSIQG